jgi:hypothetical protein
MQKQAFSGVKVATLNSQKTDVTWINYPVDTRQLPLSGAEFPHLFNHWSEIRKSFAYVLTTRFRTHRQLGKFPS